MFRQKGFTLLEIVIVIAVIALLSAVLIFLLNPAETLRRARDTQRISDLAVMKMAVGSYITSTSSPQIDGTAGLAQDKCLGGAGVKTIWLSAQDANAPVINVAAAIEGDIFTASITSTAARATRIDGGGWLPVKLSDLTGGSLISEMPVDPSNTAFNGTSTATSYTNAALMYRYACLKLPLQFEIDAHLESATYGVAGADDRAVKDGGNNSWLYEVGTNLNILPASDNF